MTPSAPPPPSPQVSRPQPASVWTTSAGSAFSGWASSRAGVPTTPGRASRRPPAGSRSTCTGRCSYWTRSCTPCPSPTHSPWIEAASGTHAHRRFVSQSAALDTKTAVTLKTTPRRGVFWSPFFFLFLLSPPIKQPNDNQTGRCIGGEFRTALSWVPHLCSRLGWTAAPEEELLSSTSCPATEPLSWDSEPLCVKLSSCKLTLVGPFSPGSSSAAGQQHLRGWNSRLLTLNKVTRVDQPRSGVRCCPAELYATSCTQTDFETLCPSYTRGAAACRFEWLHVFSAFSELCVDI